jgi:hypothetical protein
MGDYGVDDALASRFVQCQKGCTFTAVQPDWRARPTEGSPGDAPFNCPYDGSQLALI